MNSPLVKWGGLVLLSSVEFLLRFMEVDEAKEMLNADKDLFSPNEFNYIKSTINNCDVPSVKLLIKDHKDPDEKGNYPSRLVVPAKNFTAGFQHVGQRGIKAILDRNNVNYQRKTIIQASHLKEQLEVLPIDRSKNTIMSLDAEKMYPSVKFLQIERAVEYFLRDASIGDQALARKCLNLVKYGMNNSFITFGDQYWIYGGFLPVEDKGLTI